MKFVVGKRAIDRQHRETEFRGRMRRSLRRRDIDGIKCVAAGSVTFQGTGPFYVRTVERATAKILDNTIQLTLYALVEERGQTLIQIETQMTAGAAVELATTIIHALQASGGEVVN